MITAVIVVICISKAGGSDGKESACNAGNPSSIPGLGRSPGKWNGNPLQHSCLENSMGRPGGRKESDTTERLLLFVYFLSESGGELGFWVLTIRLSPTFQAPEAP